MRCGDCNLFKTRYCHESVCDDTQACENYQTVNSPLTTQIGGEHYKKMGHHQPWEVLATWMTAEELKGYMKGTVISYLARESDKGGRVDIEKAKHTIEIYLEVSDDR